MRRREVVAVVVATSYTSCWAARCAAESVIRLLRGERSPPRRAQGEVGAEEDNAERLMPLPPAASK